MSLLTPSIASSSKTKFLTIINGTGPSSAKRGRVVQMEASNPGSFDHWEGDVDHIENVNSSATTIKLYKPTTTVVAIDVVVDRELVITIYGAGTPEVNDIYDWNPDYHSVGVGAWVGRTNSIAIFFDGPDIWGGMTWVISDGSPIYAHPSAPDSVNPPLTGWGDLGFLVGIAPFPTVVYGEQTLYTLTVTDGTGSGIYLAGTIVPIVANNDIGGGIFSSWTGGVVDVDNVNSQSTTIIMNGNYSIIPTYTPPPSGADYIVSGAGVPEANGEYLESGTYGGAPAYINSYSYWLYFNDMYGYWEINYMLGPGMDYPLYYDQGSYNTYPSDSPEWFSAGIPGTDPPPIVSVG